MGESFHWSFTNGSTYFKSRLSAADKKRKESNRKEGKSRRQVLRDGGRERERERKKGECRLG